MRTVSDFIRVTYQISSCITIPPFYLSPSFIHRCNIDFCEACFLHGRNEMTLQTGAAHDPTHPYLRIARPVIEMFGRPLPVTSIGVPQHNHNRVPPSPVAPRLPPNTSNPIPQHNPTQAQPIVHRGILCDSCSMAPIRGTRWKCRR